MALTLWTLSALWFSEIISRSQKVNLHLDLFHHAHISFKFGEMLNWKVSAAAASACSSSDMILLLADLFTGDKSVIKINTRT